MVTRDEWAAVDEHLFAALRELLKTPEEDSGYRQLKDRFGTLLVKKLGAWLSARFGRSLWARGVEAEEILHEVYLRMHERLFAGDGPRKLTFETPRKLRNYLFTVAHKTAVTVLAERLPVGGNSAASPLAEAPGTTEATPALRWIWKHLPFLDPERRQESPASFEGTEFRDKEQKALFFWYVDGLPHRAIADRLDTTPNGAKQAVYRAKMKLVALMPRYAAVECLDILSPVVPAWLGQAGAHRGGPQDGGGNGASQAARGTEAGALDVLSRLAAIVRLGLEAGRPRSASPALTAYAGDMLRRKIESLLAVAPSRPAVEGVSQTIVEMLAYLTLETLRRVPRKWARTTSPGAEAGKGGEQEDGRGEPLSDREREFLVFLFFCLATMLRDRLRLQPHFEELASRVLGGAWPFPHAPSPDWYDRARAAVEELDRELSREGTPPGKTHPHDGAASRGSATTE
ncbi:MAG: RNA polymerase sigma factor, partial [Planctomycetota bacterium]